MTTNLSPGKLEVIENLSSVRVLVFSARDCREKLKIWHTSRFELRLNHNKFSKGPFGASYIFDIN